MITDTEKIGIQKVALFAATVYLRYEFPKKRAVNRLLAAV